MNIFKKELESLKKQYNERNGQYVQIKQDKENKEKMLESNKSLLANLDAARVVLQKTSEKAREHAKIRLESTMTSALQHIFGPAFSAEIEMKESAGKPVAKILVVTDYGDGNIVKTEPQDSRGGGIVDIISIALRIAMIQLHSDPPINGPIILDEPGKHVSADYSIKLAEFLKFISTQFGKQVIFVTHNDDLKSIADKSYTVAIENGQSVVKETQDIIVGVE